MYCVSMAINIVKGVKEFISNAQHVLSVSYKPDMDTFTRTVKVVLVGTILVGILAFVISLIISFITA